MAYNRRKRKVKKNIPEAVAHIHSTYNNTIVTITEKDGSVIAWASSGTIGYKGSKKKIVKLPTETVEYYSRKAGSGYGLGELEAKREVFSVKRKVN